MNNSFRSETFARVWKTAERFVFLKMEMLETHVTISQYHRYRYQSPK